MNKKPIISVRHMKAAMPKFVERCVSALVESGTMSVHQYQKEMLDHVGKKLCDEYGMHMYRRRSTFEVLHFVNDIKVYMSFFIDVIDGVEAIRLKLHVRRAGDTKRKRIAWMKLAERNICTTYLLDPTHPVTCYQCFHPEFALIPVYCARLAGGTFSYFITMGSGTKHIGVAITVDAPPGYSLPQYAGHMTSAEFATKINEENGEIRFEVYAD